MTTRTYNLNLITPCFCAGASPAQAEIRAPSIRGKLRWWFRVLGGTQDQETAVFGGAAGEAGVASALITRVSPPSTRKPWQPIDFPGVSNTGYLLYFARASSEGQRWVQTGAVPSGSSFQLHLTWRRAVEARSKALFDLALDAFLLLGTLGLRSSRGLGAFETSEAPFSIPVFEELLARIHRHQPLLLAHLAEFEGAESQLLDALGAQLRGLRSGGYSAGRQGNSQPSPLGASSPRQASAVYLRPVKTPNQAFRIVVFEAPANKVLETAFRRGAPRLKDGIPAPMRAPAFGKGRRSS